MQGKAALDRLVAEISSEYFPNNADEARQILQGGPLARARPALVRNLLIVLLKQLLFGELNRPDHIRRSAAACAVIQMHPAISQTTLSDKVNSLFLGLEDKHLMRGVATVYRVPEVRSFLSPEAKLKLRTYVVNAAEDSLVQMFTALAEIDFLRQDCIARIPTLSRGTVAKVGALQPAPAVAELNQRVVELYSLSGSFDQANTMASSIVNLVGSFDAATTKRLLQAVNNGQVRYSGGFRSVLEAIKGSAMVSCAEFNSFLEETNLADEYGDLVDAPVLRSVAAVSSDGGIKGESVFGSGSPTSSPL